MTSDLLVGRDRIKAVSRVSAVSRVAVPEVLSMPSTPPLSRAGANGRRASPLYRWNAAQDLATELRVVDKTTS
jgi:hypothetical protein